MAAFCSDTLTTMFPYFAAVVVASPLLYIALALQGIWRHMKYQTALIEGRIRPVHEAPAPVADLDARRRKGNQ